MTPTFAVIRNAKLRNDAEDGEANFRDLNSVPGEVTNLIWDSFKNRYVGAMVAAGELDLF